MRGAVVVGSSSTEKALGLVARIFSVPSIAGGAYSVWRCEGASCAVSAHGITTVTTGNERVVTGIAS